MAPEQVTQKDVDRRADVFAIGCVLYEATVGERPFHGNDAVATLYQLLEQPLVLPSARLAGYPTDLEDIVRKALERNLELRYQSAEELGSALSLWIANQGRLVTERDIAVVVTRCLGPAIAERAQRITSAESEIDAPAPAARTAEQTLGGSSASTTDVRARNSRRIWWAVAASSAALVLIGSLALSGGHSADPMPVASTPAKPSALPEAAKPEASASNSPITVMLRASPPNALLYLDDGPALPNPYQLTVTPDAIPHQLRASATGFADRVEELRLDSSKEVQLTLSTLVAGVHPPSLKPRAGAQPTTTHTAQTTHTAPIPPAPGDMPKVVTKRPRVLDPDNPFAAP